MRKFGVILVLVLQAQFTATALAHDGLELEWEADLDGGQEVPAVATDMTGEVVASHIHCAAPGANGPVGVTLFSGSFTDDDGTVAEGTISAPNDGNGCGWSDLTDVITAIAAGVAHVNVHSIAVLSGEIRANL